ncbi:hypothetical protein SLEP1_g18872 [Rubroshorea leprosula]|uniref:Secreted protein n=1 Tax=Rubroshorea leprosula TaxID=152421 RepID=A0AAV5J4Y4_9ROSI|nr:hypothetical protein SLEP1_g18872 [Rubroshorea leprosula]
MSGGGVSKIRGDLFALLLLFSLVKERKMSGGDVSKIRMLTGEERWWAFDGGEVVSCRQRCREIRLLCCLSRPRTQIRGATDAVHS